MCKLAVCFTSYSRSEIVKDFLCNWAGEYLNHNIDIYYYDSSENDITLNIIKDWNDENSHKVNYVRVDSNTHANEKAFLIFQRYALKEEYDYIWFCQEAIYANESGLDTILSLIDKGYDLIHIYPFDLNEASREYKNCVDFFRDYAWSCTLFGSTILNCKTMLDGTDWQKYRTICLNPESICYNQNLFYFNRLSEMNNTSIFVENMQGKMFVSKKKTSSCWLDRAYDVYCNDWIKSVEALPSIYNEYKDEVIKALPLKNGFATTEVDLLAQKKKGIFSSSIYEKYSEQLERILSIDAETIKKCAFYTDEELNRRFKEIGVNYWEKLEAFINKHEKVYFYGAGKIGKQYLEFTRKFSYEPDGFLVSALNGQEQKKDDIPVNIFNTEGITKGSGIIVTVGMTIADEIVKRIVATNIDYIYDTEVSAFVRYLNYL